MRFLFKLVRDGIPDIIEHAGGWCLCKRVAMTNIPKYRQLMKEKLVEEAKEVLKAQTRQEVTDKLADLAAVVDQIRILHGIPLQDVEAVKRVKEAKRGGFVNGTYVYVAHGGKP